MGRSPWNQRPVVYSHQGWSSLRMTPIHKKLTYLPQYTSNFKGRDESVAQKVLYVGNSAKSLQVSVEQSLKKLRTSYIDLLYLHWWDWDTSVEEVMRSLHTLVLQGKVLYLVSSNYHPPQAKLIQNKIGSFRYPCLGCIKSKSIRS
jgi:aryl-alcohol dehydrogenase-like predicted oxidoreductase